TKPCASLKPAEKPAEFSAILRSICRKSAMADIRIPLNDRSISDLASPDSGQYRARDTQLKGFHVIVGKRKKIFAVQGDLRKDGKRVSSIAVRIGDTGTMSTREARVIAKTYL